MTDDDPRSQIYRNVKTGHLYIVLHWTAFMHDDPYGSYIVLKSFHDGSVWVRSSEKFLGRNYDFECVPREALRAEFEGK
jgi:hypothetical protein